MNRIAISKVRKFFDDFSSVSFEKNEVIINKNEKSKNIYFLVSGEIVQSGLSTATNRVILNVYKPGSFIPLPLLFSNSPSKYYFSASKKTICKVAPSEKVAKFIKQDSAVQFEVLNRLCRGLDGVVDKLFMSYTGTAKQRVVLELLIMQNRRNNNSGILEITVTHDEVAEKCGLTRETVTRILGSLAKSGYIYKRNNKISFLNIPELRKIIA